MRKLIRSIISDHPLFDHAFPIVLTLVWIKFGMELTPDMSEIRHGIYTSLATLSGIALAASTFACTMTYQSADPLLREVRSKYHNELRRNWTSIIMSCLFCAIVPVFAMFFDSYWNQWTFSAVLYTLMLLVLRFTRSMWWLQFSLFVIGNSENAVEVEAPDLKLNK